eukprot:TRINITY_DN19_c0_g1_i6.p2 TRINITY_DN19_c0_g1~~TRINITY_DN19_c0_g1_i6.p2  ORF type:complete len:131 (-),score=30.23 TRINITY_DN19_c0_g1_i6:194-586(-)
MDVVRNVRHSVPGRYYYSPALAATFPPNNEGAVLVQSDNKWYQKLGCVMVGPAYELPSDHSLKNLRRVLRQMSLVHGQVERVMAQIRTEILELEAEEAKHVHKCKHEYKRACEREDEEESEEEEEKDIED